MLKQYLRDGLTFTQLLFLRCLVDKDIRRPLWVVNFSPSIFLIMGQNIFPAWLIQLIALLILLCIIFQIVCLLVCSPSLFSCLILVIVCSSFVPALFKLIKIFDFINPFRFTELCWMILLKSFSLNAVL